MFEIMFYIACDILSELKDKLITRFLRFKTRLYGFCPDCGCRRGRTSVVCILCGFDHWSR